MKSLLQLFVLGPPYIGSAIGSGSFKDVVAA